MRIIKLDDEEIEINVIKRVNGKKLRIPIKVDEGEELKKARIPDGVIMVKTFNDGVRCFWNKEYPYKSHYLLTKTCEDVVKNLE